MIQIFRIPIEGMTCTSCVSRITRTLGKIDGVGSVRVDLGSDTATVAFDSARTSLAVIVAVIEKAGYSATIEAAIPVTEPQPRGHLAWPGLHR